MGTDNTILLVDEDEGIRDALEVYLSRLGYKTIKVNTGQAALSAVENNSPSVVLSSTQLQDMEGVELLRNLKEKSPETEVIMLAETGDIDSALKCLRFDASDYISKPISSEALEVALQRAHNRRSTRFKIREYTEKLEVLQRNRVLLQQLFDEVPCYISLQDRKFRLTGASRRFKEDFGDHLGSYCYEVYKHRTEPCINCPVEATFEDGEPHQTEEVVTAKSGEQYNVLTWTAPIRDASGEITQVMEMSTNITQVRELENRLTSLGLLMGSTSHGIRGMLTSMDGGIYRLEAGIKKGNTEQINDACQTIKEMVNRIKDMMLDILYYTKERDLNWSRINVLDFANEVASIIKPKAEEHHIEFVSDFDQSVGVFEIDPETVSSAVVNILENSIDACLDDKSDNKLHKVIFRVKEDRDHILFDIHDNGIGMDREAKENMFTLFFSSKGHRGTGLGLFIANQIVEQHGGSIKVDSTRGQGSRFNVRLPKILPQAVKDVPIGQESQGLR